MTKYIYAVFFIFLLSGCTGNMMQLPSSSNATMQNKSQGLPSWVLKPESSNSQYFYAVGEGKNKEEARKNALGQISGQISVTISSNTITTKKVTNDTYEKNIQNTLKASTENIKFTGVSSLDIIYVNDTFYEYIQVDREILFESLKKEFEDNYKVLNDTWRSISKGDPFLIFTKEYTLNRIIIKSMADISILKSINNSFEQNQYISNIQDIRSNYQIKKSKVKIYVESSTAKNEKAVVEKAISDYGIKVISSLKGETDKANILRIMINKTTKEAPNTSKSMKLKDVKYADVKLVIVTYNGNKKIKLAQNVLNLKNGSRESYKAAVEKTKKFEREIEEQGILKILLENI